MRKFGVLLWVGVFIALTVNGQGELGYARSSRESVEQFLKRMDVQVGGDLERGRIVAIGTSGFYMKGNESDDESGLKETYDFPDEAGDDNETRRFKAVWKAYANGLARIASDLETSVDSKEMKDRNGNILSQTLKTSATQSLTGIVTITMTESCTADGEYEVTVAVCQSQKRAEAYSRGLNGGNVTLGKYTLEEWVKQKSESGLGIICPQSYCDNDGVWWRVAGVPVDLSAGRNSKKVALKTEKARRYAYEAAMRAIAVRVSTRTSTSIIFDSSERVKRKEKMERDVKIDPINMVLPVDPSQVRWFEFDMKNPLTGNSVRYVVAALRSGNSMGKPKQDTEKGCVQVQQGTAIDQAKKFIESKGWRTGREFLKTSRFAVALGGAAFKYVPSVDGAVFAQMRNDAVRQALLESAMNVAFTYDCSGELKKNLSDGNRTMQQAYVGDEAVERIAQDGMSFCDDSDTEVDLKKQGFMWWARFSSLSAEGSETKRKSVKKVLGRLSSEMPIHGLRVERQFESIVDDVYQIAFVVTCDPKRGRDMVRSFDNGQSSDERGKLPLEQWIAEQDFGMVAGPRQYVDDKGNVWMIGIAPAADGCRPFGSSLDGMAREFAAFGLSGEIHATYELSSLKSPSGEYSERQAKILYSAESSPTGKNYPKEFELVFHRDFTHPLTGRKGVVSICALRSGTRGAVKKLMGARIEESLVRTKERERKKGIRDSLLQKEKESR